MRPLIEELPRHYRNSPQDAELQRALTVLLRQAESDLNFTLAQLFPSTASGWGLPIWENAYGLPPGPVLGEEQRRSRVLAKIKGIGMTTVRKIQAIAEAFSDSPVEVVEVYDEYRFEIWYTDTITAIGDPAGMAAVVNELKPAHLGWSLHYREYVTSPICVGALPRRALVEITRGIQTPRQGVETTYVGLYARRGGSWISVVKCSSFLSNNINVGLLNRQAEREVSKWDSQSLS